MLLALKKFVIRHPSIKRWLGRAITSMPTLDLWLRNRITVSLYTPSALQVDARNLPEEARPIQEALMTRLNIDDTP